MRKLLLITLLLIMIPSIVAPEYTHQGVVIEELEREVESIEGAEAELSPIQKEGISEERMKNYKEEKEEDPEEERDRGWRDLFQVLSGFFDWFKGFDSDSNKAEVYETTTIEIVEEDTTSTCVSRCGTSEGVAPGFIVSTQLIDGECVWVETIYCEWEQSCTSRSGAPQCIN